jgi:hypothetical protein
LGQCWWYDFVCFLCYYCSQFQLNVRIFREVGSLR